MSNGWLVFRKIKHVMRSFPSPYHFIVAEYAYEYGVYDRMCGWKSRTNNDVKKLKLKLISIRVEWSWMLLI